jgi:2-polyprenyl-3-methyl-5-hydroxy-6-metoxy-1,4-benzoquinol methylase
MYRSFWVEFARAMAPLMQMPAQLLASPVGGDSGQPLRVLDVAAGHGLFGITIAGRYRQSHVTALDWPDVLVAAAENARRADVAERYAVLPDAGVLRSELHPLPPATQQAVVSYKG